MSDLQNMTVRALAAAVRTRKLSAVEAVQTSMDKIRAAAALNNFITVCEERALAAARRVDDKLARGEAAGALCGVTVAVKDNLNVSGLATTCGSRLYIDNIAEISADSVVALENAGAVVIGKTNMDELAMGSTNESSAFGCVKNVLDDTRVPGGSSGGSANAVAAKQALFALGTDTGGSIRQPAAYCGVVGLKPTFGAVSTRGLTAFVPSLDTVGILSGNCDDAAVVFDALSGRKTGSPRGDVKGVTVGIAEEFGLCGKTSDEVWDGFMRAADMLKRLGVNVKRISIPSFGAGLSAYHILSSAEAAHNIIRTGGDFSLVGGEVKRRITLGTLVTSGGSYDELYIRAAKVRAEIKREYLVALGECDAIICPTAPTSATKLGELSDPNKSHYGDYFLAPASLAGLPAVSVPYGGGEGKLPIGVQVIGNFDREDVILNIGRAIELIK